MVSSTMYSFQSPFGSTPSKYALIGSTPTVAPAALPYGPGGAGLGKVSAPPLVVFVARNSLNDGRPLLGSAVAPRSLSSNTTGLCGAVPPASDMTTNPRPSGATSSMSTSPG